MKKLLYPFAYMFEVALLCIASFGAALLYLADAIAQDLPDKDWFFGKEKDDEPHSHNNHR